MAVDDAPERGRERRKTDRIARRHGPAARERAARLANTVAMTDEEYEAYLVQVIDALFAVSITMMNLPF